MNFRFAELGPVDPDPTHDFAALGRCVRCGIEVSAYAGPFPFHGYWTAADGSGRPCNRAPAGALSLLEPSPFGELSLAGTRDPDPLS